MKDTTQIKTLPGTLSSMKRPEYDADTKRMRSTALKDLVIPEQGPAAYFRKHELRIVDEEASGNHFDLGNLLHEWVLEGKRNWAVATMRRDERTQAYKDFMAENAGKTIITAKEERDLCNWREGIFRNREARRVLELPRYQEQVVLWDLEVEFADDEGELFTVKIPCKASIDAFPFAEFRRYDLKSDAGMKAWDRTVFDLGYHQQAAWYEWGVESLPAYKNKPSNFSHIAVEKKAPYWCYVRPLSESALRYGRRDCELAIERYCECVRRQELYALDGRPAIDAWPDLKEAKQHEPVGPTQFYEEQYGAKRSEPTPIPTSHETVAYDEESNEHDVPADFASYLREHHANGKRITCVDDRR